MKDKTPINVPLECHIRIDFLKLQSLEALNKPNIFNLWRRLISV